MYVKESTDLRLLRRHPVLRELCAARHTLQIFLHFYLKKLQKQDGENLHLKDEGGQIYVLKICEKAKI